MAIAVFYIKLFVDIKNCCDQPIANTGLAVKEGKDLVVDLEG